MKFFDEIRAMGPGQLLINPADCSFEIVDGFLCLSRNKTVVDRVLYQDQDGWEVIDKPRPRVRFDAAMRAALDGKVIRTHFGDDYRMLEGLLVFEKSGCVIELTGDEIRHSWEIIEPEGDK